MQTVESTTSTLISSIQAQTDQLSQHLAKFQEAENILDSLSDESHLDFITVSKKGMCFQSVSMFLCRGN